LINTLHEVEEVFITDDSMITDDNPVEMLSQATITTRNQGLTLYQQANKVVFKSYSY